MSILVTGGKGYIGAKMIRKLLDKGHSVVCLDLKTTPGRLGDDANRVTMLAGGVSGVDELVKIIKQHNIDRIAHMVFFVSYNAEQIWQEISVMVAGTANIFEAARLMGVRKVVFPSSIRYYGPQWLYGEVNLTEDSPSLSDNTYGIGKRLSEVLAYAYNIRAGMSIVSFRLPTVYGPGARIGANGVNIAAVDCALGKPAVLPYSPGERVCIAHVDDVAEALLIGLLNDNPKHFQYNVGGHTVSYRELAALVREFLPNAQISFNETSGRITEPYLIDYSRIKQEFGFEHRPLREGYLDLINVTRREAGLPELSMTRK